MPTFLNPEPAPGTQLARVDALHFEVTDPAGLASVFVWVSFADGTTEVVWTGDGFGPRYSASTSEAIPTGRDFTVRRVGGWALAPMLRATAIATDGGAAQLSVDYEPAAAETTEPAAVVGAELPPVAATDLAAVVVGRGLLAPLRRDGKGDFANASGLDVLRSNVGLVLGTIGSSNYTRGELPWRPEFGSLLHLLRHKNNDQLTRSLARQYVIDAITFWEPRVRVRRVEIGQEGARLSLLVRYDVLSRRRGGILARGEEVSTDMELF